MNVCQRQKIARGVLLGLVLVLAAVPAIAQVEPALANAEAYLATVQNADGSFGTITELAPRDSALAVLALVDGVSPEPALTQGAVYLEGVAEANTAFRSRRALALAETGRAFEPLLDSIFDFKNGGGFGAYALHESNLLDTAYAIEALALSEGGRLLEIASFLDFVQLHQNADGGWGLVPGGPSDVYFTAEITRALTVLEQLSVGAGVLGAAGDYLLAGQLADASYGDPLGTAVVYRALLAAGRNNEMPFGSPVGYLLASQVANGSWENDAFVTAQVILALRGQRPNLVIADFDAPASSPSGELIGVTVTLRNDGPEAAAASHVEIRYDTADGALGAEAPVPALAPGEEAVIQLEVASDGLTDSVTLFAVADARGEILESDEDNATGATITLRAGPDLALFPADLAVVPEDPQPGQNFNLRINAQNLGETEVTSFEYRVTRIGAGPDEELRVANAGPVAPGAAFVINVPLNFAEGEHTLRVELDPNGTVDEENEANNDTTLGFFVVDPSRPDLAITDADLVLTPALPDPGNPADVSVTVQNLGGREATTTVELWENGLGGTRLRTWNVTVAAGSFETVSDTVSLSPGAFSLLAVADPEQLVLETEEGNNRVERFFRELPDLAIGLDNLEVLTPAPLAGDPVEVALTVRNAGTAAADNVLVEVYENSPVGTVVFSEVFATIPASGNRSATFTWTASAGTNVLVAVADESNTILEFSETNNSVEREVNIPRATGPDLLVTSLDKSALVESAETLNLAGSITVNVRNDGDADVTTPFEIRLFEDNDGNGRQNGGETLLGSTVVSDPIPVGGSLAVHVAVSSNVSFHHPLAWARVDATDAIAEQREDNNAAALFGDCETAPPAGPAFDGVTKEWSVPGLEVQTAPLVVQLSDDNADGAIDSRDTPDVVFHTIDATGRAIMALSGLDGTQLWAFRSTPANPLVMQLGQMAAADLDGDGVTEVIGQQRNGRLIALDHRGGLLWVSDRVEGVGDRGLAGPSIGDLDADGVPEIVFGRAVLSNTGELIALGTANRGQNRNYYGPFGVVLVPGASGYPQSLIADIDLDGVNEIVAGDAVYRLNGGSLDVVWNATVPDRLMDDGFAAVGNLDGDPEAEIVYVSSGQIMVLNHNGSTQAGRRVMVPFSPFTMPTFWGSAPTIVNLDGNGAPEILVTTATRLIAYRANLSQMWTRNIGPDFGGVTGVSAFDLDGDGTSEVFFNDEKNFYILNGLNGSVLYTTPNTSKTAMEYPVVADVDGDGQAEILLGSNKSFQGSTATQGLHVLGHPTWRGTRPIWNQYGYSVTNIALDGTVPSPQVASWQADNVFRSNRELPVPPLFQGNLTVSFPRVGSADTNGIPVTLRVGNGGRAAVQAGTVVRLYSGNSATSDPATAPLAAEVTLAEALQPGTWRDVEAQWLLAGSGGDAFAVVDPDNAVAECDESDNILDFVMTETILPDLAVAPGGVAVPNTLTSGQDATVAVTVANDGSALVTSFKVRLYDGDPVTGSVLGEVTGGQLDPNATAVVEIPYPTLGTTGLRILHAVVDPDNEIQELRDDNNSGLAQTELLAPTQADPSLESFTVTPAQVESGQPTTLVAEILNRGAPFSDGFTVAFRADNVEVGRLVSPGLFGTGETRTIEFVLETASLSAVVEVEAEIDPDGALSEVNEGNNEATAELQVTGSTLALSTSTDQLSYEVGDDVAIQVTSNNLGAERTSVLAVRIVDALGALVTTVSSESTLLPAGTSVHDFTWNVGNSLPGGYSVVAEVLEGAVPVARSVSLFSIARDAGTRASLFTDREVYTPLQAVILNGSVGNTGANDVLSDLVATIAIEGAAGEVFRADRQIPALFPGSDSAVGAVWEISGATAGDYTASLSLRDSFGVLLAYASTALTVEDSSQTGAGLDGDLVVSPSTVGAGAPLLADFTLRNGGNAAMPDLEARVDIVRLADGTVAASLSTPKPLGIGANTDGSLAFSTLALEEGDYLATLFGVLPGSEVRLDRASFTTSRGVSIQSVLADEGDSGSSGVTLVVTLSSASTEEVTVDFATNDGSATVADGDYEATSGTLTFAPGEVLKTFPVTIYGDTNPEAEEVFLVTLSNAVGVTLGKSQALVTIRDEEGCSSPNLLENGDAERGATFDRPLDGWNEVQAGWRQRFAAPPPLSGIAAFGFAGLEDVAEIYQDIDVAAFAAPIDNAAQSFLFDGFLYTSGAPESGARVIVEYRDTLNATVLDSFDSGDVLTGESWQSVVDQRVAPVGTRFVRVRLLGSRLGGTETLAFFDRLALRSLGTPTLTVVGGEILEGNTGTTPSASSLALSCALPNDLDVTVTTVDGTATVDDYNGQNGTVTIPAGETSVELAVNVIGDTSDEDDEDFRVNASISATDVVVLTNSAEIVILDDDGAVIVGTSAVNLTEDNGTASFEVALSAASGKTVSVDYNTAALTALAGDDFTTTSGTLTFAPGETAKTVDVAVTPDQLNEPDETFRLVLSNPVNASLDGTSSSGTATIFDDDVVEISALDGAALEGDDGTSQLLFTVSLTVPSTSAVTVDYATAAGTAAVDDDFVATAGSLSFAPGTTTTTVAVPLVSDLVREPVETFLLLLSNPAGGLLADPEAVGSILDDDGILISAGDVVLREARNLARDPGVTINVSSTLGNYVPSRAIDGNLGRSWFTSCGDAANLGSTPFYELEFPGAVSVLELRMFGNRQSANGNDILSGIFQLFDADGNVLYDSGDVALPGPERDLSLLLSLVPNVRRFRFTFTDDEGCNPGFAEIEIIGGAEAVVPVTLSKAATAEVTVDYTTTDISAVAGEDYQSTSGTLTFPVGATLAEIPVLTLDDLTIELPETYSVDLSNAVEGILVDGQAEVTIIDDDGWVPNGSADDTAIPGCVVLTPDLNNQIGSAWWSRQLNMDQSWDKTFRLFMGTRNAGEGGYFVMHQDPDGLNTVGSGGGAEGYGSGIRPSFGVEIDTSTFLNNARTDHISMAVNGGEHTGAAPVDAIPGQPDIADGQEHLLRIIWNATTDTFDVHFDDAERLVHSRDVVGTIFGNDPQVTWGFVAATSSLRNLQYFCDTAVCEDGTGETQVSVGDVHVTEGDSGTKQVHFPVTLSCPVAHTVEVDFITVDDTATAGEDYGFVQQRLVFLPGETSKTVTVDVYGDNEGEADEIFIGRAENPIGATVRYEGHGYIRTDDIGVYVEDVEVFEGDDFIYEYRASIKLTHPAPSNIRVNYTLANGTATVNNDYVRLTSSLTFTPGQDHRTVRFRFYGDTISEGDEHLFLRISNPTGLGVINDGEAVITIRDDDECPSSNLLVNGGANLPLVNGEIPGWTEVLGTDWRTSSNRFEGSTGFFAGTAGLAELAQDVDVGTFGQAIDAGIQAFEFIGMVRSANQSPVDYARIVVEYRSAEGVVLDTWDSEEQAWTAGWHQVGNIRTAPAGTRTVRVRLIARRGATNGNNDGYFDALLLRGLNYPSLSIADATVNEGELGTTPATFNVSLSCPSISPVTVDYLTSNGTAEAPSDYEATVGTLVFAPGELTQTVTVPVVGDTVVEDAETFVVNLVNSNYASIGDGEAVGTIQPDETFLTVSDIFVTEGNEGTTDMTFIVRLSTSSQLEIRVDYETVDQTAIAGSDYEGVSGTLVFAPGERNQRFTVPITGDLAAEDDETLGVLLSNPVRTRIQIGEAVGTIRDDDLSISIADASVVEGGNADGSPSTVDMLFDVTLSETSAVTVRVDYTTEDVTATAGEDYTAVSGTVTFAAGQTLKRIAVPVSGDLLVEASESFAVLLSNPQNGGIVRSEAYGSITDDDDAPSDNLLINHSAEMFPRAGELPYWTEVQGTTWTRGINNPNPHSGGAHFDPGNVANAELAQDVDVSAYANLIDLGIQRFLFEGFVRSGNENPADEGRFVLDYLDESGTVLESFDSGPQTTTEAWEQVVDLRTAPIGTRTIRVRLIAERVSGGSNDAAFDTLVLRSIGTPVVTIDNGYVDEGDDVDVDLVLPVTLTKAAEDTVRFNYNTSDATALAGSDYTAQTGTIEIAPGETTAEIRVPVTGDRDLELEEFFRITITDFEGKAVLFEPQAIGFIRDDDNVGGSVRELRTFILGDVRIFAWTDNTEITLIDIATGLPLNPRDSRLSSKNFDTNPFVLEKAGDSFEGFGNNLQVRIVANDALGDNQIRPISVWTGYLNASVRHPELPPPGNDPWMSYIPAISVLERLNGRELGRSFLGFTSEEMYIFVKKDPAAPPTVVVVEDLETNTDPDSDDNHILGPADAVYADDDVEIYHLTGFEDDTVRVTTSVEASVLVGKGSTANADWTVTPPSYADGEDGIELGTEFYAFVNRSLTVFPTRDDTTVTITDLSDGDDSITFNLANGDTDGPYDIFTPVLGTRNGGSILPRSNPIDVNLISTGNPFDNDFVKVTSDKPILVYVGPAGSDVQEFADVAFSIPTGPESRIIYAYAQNGAQNDLQIFGFDDDTEVQITSLTTTSNFGGNVFHDFTIGPGVGGSGGWQRGTADSDVWWSSGVWGGEMLRIESNKPVLVINGDYDGPHFGAFIPFVVDTDELPPIADAGPDRTAYTAEVLSFDGTNSFDQDENVGPLEPRYEWDFDTSFDSDGDGNPANDVDSTEAMPQHAYLVPGEYEVQLTYYDDEGESDNDFAIVSVDAHPLVLTKADDTDLVAIGGLVNYTLTLTNTSDADVTGILVNDPLPTNTVLSGLVTTTVGTVDSLDPVQVTVGTLAPGASVTITLAVQVTAGSVEFSEISNQAFASSVELPTVPSDDPSTTDLYDPTRTPVFDNCPGVENPDQSDSDGDGLGDACDVCPIDPENDADGDGVCGDIDNCPTANPDQADGDLDGVGDACDVCPADPDNDADGDGVCGDIDNCPTANPDQADGDGDGIGDACDVCPADPDNDADGDGVCGDVDNCPDVSNPDQADGDGDGVGDVCDVCPATPENDADGDGVCGDVDNCPDTSNPDQADGDADGAGDVCDVCPADADDDVDGDGVCGDVDNCPFVDNPDQTDSNSNGIGDACDVVIDCDLQHAVRATTGDVNISEYAIINSYDSCRCLFSPVFGSSGGVQAGGNTNVHPNASVSGAVISGVPTDSAPVPLPDGLSLQGNLEVRSNETLVLAAGDYYYDAIFIKDNSRLETTGRVRIWFRSRLEIGGNAPIRPLNDAPSNLTFYSTDNANHVEVKSNAFMVGSLVAPNVQNVRIDSNAEIFGAVVGASVLVQPNAIIHLDTALCDACPEPPASDVLPVLANGLEATGGIASIGQFALVDSFRSCDGAYGGVNVLANGNVQASADVTLHPDAIVNGALLPDTESLQASVPIPDGLVSSGTLFINSNQSVTLPPGDYLYEDVFINSNGTLLTQGQVRIWFTGRLEIGSNANAEALSGVPTDLWFFGGCSDGDVLINESSAGVNLVGVVYAPDLPVLILSNSHIFGAVVGADIEVRPNANVHYDEALGGSCP